MAVKKKGVFDRVNSLLLPFRSVEIGVSTDGDELRYSVALCSKRRTRVVFSGKGYPWYLRSIAPSSVHVDIGQSPFLYVNGTIDDENGEFWTERNKNSVVPAGFSENEIANDYTIIEKNIYSVTVTSKAINERVAWLTSRGLAPATISVPLWDLAQFYQSYIDHDSYLLLKIGSSGSLLALVESGYCQKIITLWPDCNDIEESFTECLEYITQALINVGDNKKIPVLIYSGTDPLDKLKEAIKKQFLIIDTPDINGIPLEYHESAALSLRNQNHFDLTPFDISQKVAGVKNYFTKVQKFARLALFLLCLITIVLSGAAVIGWGAGYFNRESFAETNSQLTDVKQLENRRDSLLTTIAKSARFSMEESRLTTVISSLQDCFPEGLWAEEIYMAEVDITTWRIDIRAAAFSSSLITQFMDRCNSVAGLIDTRIVWSEHARVENSKNGVKIKIECLWSPEGKSLVVEKGATLQ